MNLRKDHYRNARSLGRLARRRDAAVQTSVTHESNGRGSPRVPSRKDGTAVDRRERPWRFRNATVESLGGRLPVSRRSGYLSRRRGGDGESIGGRRSSSGIRCPAASYAVASARFKEPRVNRSSRPPTSGGRPASFFLKPFLFCGDTERGERCQSGRCRCGGSVDRLRRRGRT